MLLSLFCGVGGLDLGFENVGFEVGLALDRRADSVTSYNRNRPNQANARVEDISDLDLDRLDTLLGTECKPAGVIGGPPCQSFSQANVNQSDNDPRHMMPVKFAAIISDLNKRSPVDFFVFENVVGLTLSRHKHVLEFIKAKLDNAGFNITQTILDSADYGTPQVRRRLFLVGINRHRFGSTTWTPPTPTMAGLTVSDAIRGLPEPVHFSRGIKAEDIPFHANHWCMAPKSPKFSNAGKLREGYVKSRSFKTLSWDSPSITVAYGNREVHIHPDGKRRLSVYEALQLQGFPKSFVLHGSLSSQITQVSEAVPPPLATVIAQSIKNLIAHQRAATAA